MVGLEVEVEFPTGDHRRVSLHCVLELLYVDPRQVLQDQVTPLQICNKDTKSL